MFAKWIVLSCVGLSFLPAGVASAQQKPAAPAPANGLTAQSSVDQILDALDVRGKNLEGFVADVRLTETDDLQNESTRVGKVRFQSRPGDDGARILVSFDAKENNNRQFPEKIDYLLDKGWLVDRDYQHKIEVRRQVLKPGEKANLLKLGQGPFPLPIGQDKAEVHRQFDVKKAPPAKDDPANTVHLTLTPLKGSTFERKMSQMDVWVDLKLHFPAKIEVAEKVGGSVRSTELQNVKVNPSPALGDKDFALPVVAGGWDLHEEPFRE